MHSFRKSTDLHQHSRSRVAWVCLLVVMVLGAQSLGLWHRLVHFEPIQPNPIGFSQPSNYSSAEAHGIAAELFSNHHADTDCHLFDQLSQADGVTSNLAIAVAMWVLFKLQRISHGLAVARWHALFQARGPPFVR